MRLLRLLAIPIFCFLPYRALAQESGRVYLSELEPVSARQGFGQLGLDVSVQGNRLRIGDKQFARGLGTHANSEIVYDLEEPCERFEAVVGVDAEMAGYTEPSVVFRVLGDGRVLFDSGVMRITTPAMPVSVPLAGVRELRLVVTDAGDNINCDHADWADAALVGVKRAPGQERPQGKLTVRAPGIAVSLAEDGRVAGVALGREGAEHAVWGGVTIGGCRPAGQATSRKLPGGGVEFRAALAHGTADQCVLVQRFVPTRSSVRWLVEVRGEGSPWSAPIRAALHWPDADRLRVWTAWGDPEPAEPGWHDPLVAMPFAGRQMGLGGDIAIPLVSVLDPARDTGLSLVQSPEDALLAVTLSTRADGTATLSHYNQRIAASRTVRLAMDLVAHEADWRGGLRWMVARYPAYFNPPNPAADDAAGGGAYSTWEGALDTPRLKRMAFRTNWKASYDFPYMGMFMPPVTRDTDTWPRFDPNLPGGVAQGQHALMSRRQLADYSRRMREQGFRVLNYFNVTEFGAFVRDAEQVHKSVPSSDLWKDCTDFLYTRIADGLLPTADGGRYGTWGGAVAMDPGGPQYQRFLLDQARRHIQALPDSSGICIDRTDWLALYNPKADDGVSWVDGKPARSLFTSWKDLMARLGPMMHRAGKVIFVNPLCTRLDIMRQVDGIYAEFGGRPTDFNRSALMGVRKPVMQWTGGDADLRPDPNHFFQRHLYMGCFPTVPFPENDHTINPSAWAEPFYLEYGPMLEALHGRKWVLSPRPVTVEGGTAKANLFEVPDGYVVPVVFGGAGTVAVVTLRGLRDIEGPWAEMLQPGSERWMPMLASVKEGAFEVTVPLPRGCALIRIRRAQSRSADGVKLTQR